MIKVISVVIVLFCFQYCLGQNVGIGVSSPINKLQVSGSILVNEPTTKTNTPPTGPQTKTMTNGTTLNYSPSDSTGRVYDPGGPSANYIANLVANVAVVSISSGNVGYDITIEDIELGTGDSLIIRSSSDPLSTVFLAVGNGYSTTGNYLINAYTLFIYFKSNADASVGRGFALLFKRIYPEGNIPDVTGYAGKSFFFDSRIGALRGGYIGVGTIGTNSTAFGEGTIASGPYSTALGSSTRAGGNYATALGSATTANGAVSTAMGNQTTASGHYSTALGYQSIASGDRSIAMGYQSIASGISSSVMGYGTNSKSFGGLVIGTYNENTNPPSAIIFDPGNRLFQIGNGTSDALRSNAMTVLQNGKVGIGLTAPIDILDVADRIRLRSGPSGTAGLWLNKPDNSAPAGFIGTYDNNTVGMYGHAGAGWSYVMNTINGNVGIGILSPVSKLDVNGNASFNNYTILLRGGSDLNHGLRYDGGPGINGPYLFGYDGGALGTIGLPHSLTWDYTGSVIVRNHLTVQNGNTSVYGNLTVQNGKGIIRSADGTQQKKQVAIVNVSTIFSAGQTKTISFTWPETFGGAPDAYVGAVTCCGGWGWAEVIMTVTADNNSGGTLYVYNANQSIAVSTNFNIKIIAIGPQ